MATSSKYIQLSSSVLMEYIYADQSVVNTVGNQYRLNTTTNPIWLMENAHNNEDIILNGDTAEYIQIASNIGTGNVRNRAFAYIDPYKNALLSLQPITPYNDYDPDLTPTANLPVVFSTPQAPVYDTIRLHLVQGFNFETYQGLTLNIKALKKDGKLFNLLNFVFNKTDTFETLNPSSFFFAGRVYDSYIEVKVLSLYNLIYDYWLGNLTGNTVVEKITKNVGIQKDQQIQVSFSWIREKVNEAGQNYIYLFDSIQCDIPTQDQFEAIAAEIKESEGGDYIEFFATYKGDIIQKFIIDLNRSGYDFILLHDLIVSEYIYDSTSNQYYWQKTDELQISQTQDYESPNVYRPIIKNPSAISFKIDYVVRLYNRNDNSQIWKRSSMISNSVAKYGRKLLQINLGQNPVKSVIYNQNIVKDIQIKRIAEPVLANAKYVTAFLDNTLISASFDSINPDVDIESAQPSNLVKINKKFASGGGGSTIYANGLARILISESVCFLKFVIYTRNSKNGTNTPMNLSGIGELILSFISDTGENLDIQEYPSNFTSKSHGEVVFRLSELQSKQVLTFANRQFRLFLLNGKKERTFLYNGLYYNQKEWQNIAQVNKLAEFEKQMANLTGVNTQLMAQVKNQSLMITGLHDQIATLTKQLSEETKIAELESVTIKNLQNQLNSHVSTIKELNSHVQDLNSSLSLSNSKILSENGMIAELQKQLAAQSIVLGATSINIVKEPPIKMEPHLVTQLEPVKASIKTTPATTYTQPGGGGGPITPVKSTSPSQGTPNAPAAGSPAVSSNSGGGGGGGGCFLAGTLVTMADGNKLVIENVQTGMRVLTFNEITGEQEPGVVTDLMTPTKSDLISLDLSDGTIIECTSEHPFWVVNKGWSSFNPKNTLKYHEIEVSPLDEGDILINEEGEEVTLDAILPIILTGPTKVHNLTIEGNHTYYANGILVHNKMAATNSNWGYGGGPSFDDSNMGGGGYNTFYNGNGSRNQYLTTNNE